MTKYYSLYIRHNFVFFPGYNKSNFLGKYNIQVQYLIIFDFKKSSFYLFLIFVWFFPSMGVCSTREPNVRVIPWLYYLTLFYCRLICSIVHLKPLYAFISSLAMRSYELVTTEHCFCDLVSYIQAGTTTCRRLLNRMISINIVEVGEEDKIVKSYDQYY
jgi:hypothetical protein